MNKEHFKEEMSAIEFPKREVFDAIDKGINKGRKEKRLKRRSLVRAVTLPSSIAASIFLVSGLLFAPVSNVLASVPLLGTLYEKYSIQIGSELFSNHLITTLNEEATHNGVSITITSAYYDGNVMGITFKTNGDKITNEKINETESVAGYNFHLFDGEDQSQWTSSHTQLEEAEDGYIAAIEFYNPNADLPEHFTLPITFTSIAGIKGTWKFDVPVTQIPSETVTTKGKSIYEDQGFYSIDIDSITKGKATTFVRYTTTTPLVGEDDRIQITVFDSNGNRLSKSHAYVLSIQHHDGVIKKDIRELFSSKIQENIDYLILKPEIRRDEQDTLSSLEKNTPFIVESKRFDYQLQINHIEQNENEVIIDYHLHGIERNELREDLIQNFIDFIELIKTENLREKESGELDMNQMVEYEIRSDHTEKIDDSSLHFQSIFTIQESTTVNDYSIIVPFGSLSSNKPIEMEPIKIELRGK